MGIGFNAKQRIPILGPSITTTQLRPKVVVVDVPACIRNLMTRSSSPSMLARQLLQKLKKSYGEFDHIECYFDDASNMHARRSGVSLVRASRVAPLTVENEREIEALQLSSVLPAHLDMQMPWEILLKTPITKMICWELLARALFQHAIKGNVNNVKVHSQNYCETTGTVTPTGVMWGEADMMCADAAAQLSNVLIATIDYDMVLQSLIGLPTVGAESRWVGFKAEVVDSGMLSTMYGPSEDQRLHAAVLLLCAFKSDYSKAICKKVGMTTKQLVEHMKTSQAQACLVERTDATGTRLIFRPPMLGACLRKPPPLEAIADILWCICYFRGYGANRTPPGPEVTVAPDTLLKQECIVCEM